jgi:hypothetical protein
MTPGQPADQSRRKHPDQRFHRTGRHHGHCHNRRPRQRPGMER